MARKRSGYIVSASGLHNRLGFAIQLCYLHFPGQAMTLEAEPLAELLAHVARQIQVDPGAWTEYAGGMRRNASIHSSCKAPLVTGRLRWPNTAGFAGG
ncbi:MAG: DUF4158 domain-containing protein [Verrucomicrobia bacterium]|nr:DUF4158 domain-containing protein [Verrucomicrobiota bacterium]